jgi:hypothetical protein
MCSLLKMDETTILAFLKKVTTDYEEKKLSEEEKRIISEFFMEFSFLQDKSDKSEKNMMKYLFLGWFIHSNFGK